MDAEVFVLSDSSEDLDSLPSFRERVLGLVRSKNCEANKNAKNKVRMTHIHAISDSESDSKEDTKEKSLSPVHHSLIASENELKDICMSSDDDLPDLKVVLRATHKDDLQCPLDVGSVERDDSCDTINELLKKRSKTAKAVKNFSQRTKKSRDKEEEIKHRMKVKKDKRKEKEFVKALKASEKEILKSQKPEECLKNMKIIVDRNLLFLDGSQLISSSLNESNLKYCVEENIIKHSVLWYRTVTNIVVEENEILKQETDGLVNVVLLVIPNEEFLRMIHSFVQKTKEKNTDNPSFADCIINVKNLYPEMDITCVTVGFDRYMRNIKEQDNSDLKILSKQIRKSATDQALIELQLQTFINFNFLDNMTELGNLLCHFTKAISEKPLRKEKELQKHSFSWYADINSNCPIKLANDGCGFIKLWQQQVQQFQNVSPEVAEAIVSRYPSPRLLLKAYKACASMKEADMLLQDIVVRRNYGPLGTQKRIGPELSFKLHTFFRSLNGNQILKR